MTDETTGPLWSVPSDCRFLWERFGEVCLLFNPLSGTTHLLNELVIDILEEFQKDPVTLDRLIVQLGLEKEREAVRPRIQQVLAEMDYLGLIRPLDP